MDIDNLLIKIEKGFQVGCRFSFSRKEGLCWSSVGLQKWKSKYKVYVDEILESNMLSEEYMREEIIEFENLDDALKFIEENTNAKICDLATCKGQKIFNPLFNQDQV